MGLYCYNLILCNQPHLSTVHSYLICKDGEVVYNDANHTVKRADVLRELAKLKSNDVLDTVRFPDEHVHLDATDLQESSSLVDAQNNAFTLTGHMIQE